MAITIMRRIAFSPQDDARSAMLDAAAGARHSLHTLAYALSDPRLIALLVAKRKAGLEVGVVVDSTQARGHVQRPLMEVLTEAGVEVVCARSPAGGIQHQKTMLIDVGALGPEDDSTLCCYGSFNFSASAQREVNLFIVDNDATLCAAFWTLYVHLRAWGLAHTRQLEAVKTTL